jgi:hypothetical protein
MAAMHYTGYNLILLILNGTCQQPTFDQPAFIACKIEHDLKVNGGQKAKKLLENGKNCDTLFLTD